MQNTRFRRIASAVVLGCLAGLPACAKRMPASGVPDATRVIEMREGLASWYGEGFHGRLMASGGRFDMHAMVAAHPTYPFGTLVRITNLANRRQVRVRILDRGPAAGPRADGVIVDLSRAAADALGFLRDGRTRVRLEVLEWGERRRTER
jgi:rare lipoprotein A